MVDIEFKSRAKHFIPLSVLKGIAAGDTPEYLTSGDVNAIKGMALLNRGRLSVQKVDALAWNAIQTMAEKGGWDEEQGKKTKGRKKRTPGGKEGDADLSSKEPAKPKGNPRKRKTEQTEGDEDSVPVRRSTRTRTKV